MKTRAAALSLAIFTSAAIAAAIAATVGSPDKDNKDFVAHEWGTFTSVQGADGVQVLWDPLVASDLPNFVYDTLRAASPTAAKSPFGFRVSGKIGTATRQRMETPVIYFYSDRSRTVDVDVSFPQGTITEWYPQRTATAPLQMVGGARVGPALRWKNVEVLPMSKNTADSSYATLPLDSSGSHYFAARETDAAVLRMPSAVTAAGVGADSKPEQEKFLFYRGTAGFTAPLITRVDGADRKSLQLTNSGVEELRNLFVYEVKADGTGQWTHITGLKSGKTETVLLGGSAATRAPLNTLAPALTAALVREGLYEKEAAAMVKTWETSWFAEKGVRVLYTLPRAWTDRILPLDIKPAPAAVERVMVGRAEVILPETEEKVLSLIQRYTSADEATRPAIVTEARALGLGRFFEPSLRRVVGNGARGEAFTKSAYELMNLANQALLTPLKATAAK